MTHGVPLMLIVAALLLVLFALALPLLIRPRSIPPPEVASPTQHLEDKKATIYENLRDLQAEYHMGKLSDQDYQQTKLDLQRELAGVLAEMERITGQGEAESPASAGAPAKQKAG